MQKPCIVILKEQKAEREGQVAMNINHNFWFQGCYWPNLVCREGQRNMQGGGRLG